VTFSSQMDFISNVHTLFVSGVMAYEVLGVNLIILLASLSAFCVIFFLFIKKLKKDMLHNMALLILVAATVGIIALASIGMPSPEPTITLTEEEKEVDLFLSDYYLSLNDGAVDGVLALFSEDAVLISSDGNGYTGIHEIRTYYEGIFRKFVEYRIIQKALEIEVEDGFAKASYCTKSYGRYPGATVGDVRSFREDFVLIKEEESWKIIGLKITNEWCDLGEEGESEIHAREGPPYSKWR